ncbi:MAG: glycosyltransferase family 9 protein [Phycisphaerales bacterium]|nr:glycosyltransferase family 9 protein [Phycisphaerales bacterium]
MSRSSNDIPRVVGKPLRLLVICPSWLGDVVMATPALRLLRKSLPGTFIGALVRPGLDELLAGSDLVDEVHVDRARGVMGPKVVASRIRPRRYDAALLLTNSFSTALIARLAFIPRRVGYDRDGRGLLLTDRIKPDRVPGSGAFACVPAVEYYLRAGRALLGIEGGGGGGGGGMFHVELSCSPEQERAGEAVLERVGIAPGTRYAVLNPGANNPAKRWPGERFAQIAAHLVQKHGLHVLVSGGPGESELVDAVVEKSGEPARVHGLVKAGVTIGALKRVVRGAALMVSNDTGPKHIAAAFKVPTVTLYGPTDPRWTTLPASSAAFVEIVADPTLPADQIADDHPERCAIDRIELSRVREAVDALLSGAS